MHKQPEIDADHVMRLIAGARSAYGDGAKQDCLDRLRKIKFILDSHKRSVKTIDDLIGAIENEINKNSPQWLCEECRKPLLDEEERELGFHFSCLNKIETEMTA